MGLNNENIDMCNTCGGSFSDDPNVCRQSLKNKRWLATLNEDGDVIQECCECCAQEAEDMS